MTEPDHPQRLSFEAAHRPPSIRSLARQSPSPSPQPANRGSRHPSTESAPPGGSPPNLPEESTLKARDPPQFQPLFTLVSDTTARAPQTHHPRVHYVFSDDDPDVLAEALDLHHQSLTATGASPDRSTPQGPGRDRAIVLDLVPTDDGRGYDIAWASSLSADWAVTGTRLSRMEGGTAQLESDGGEEENARSFMLRIEGVSVEGASTSLPGLSTPGGKTPSPETELQSSGASAARPSGDDYGTLIDDFEKRMAVLKKVVNASEDRQRSVDAAQAEQDGETQRAVEQNTGPKEDGGGD